LVGIEEGGRGVSLKIERMSQEERLVLDGRLIFIREKIDARYIKKLLRVLWQGRGVDRGGRTEGEILWEDPHLFKLIILEKDLVQECVSDKI
jgi:hypothetical protein